MQYSFRHKQEENVVGTHTPVSHNIKTTKSWCEKWWSPGYEALFCCKAPGTKLNLMVYHSLMVVPFLLEENTPSHTPKQLLNCLRKSIRHWSPESPAPKLTEHLCGRHQKHLLPVLPRHHSCSRSPPGPCPDGYIHNIGKCFQCFFGWLVQMTAPTHRCT